MVAHAAGLLAVSERAGSSLVPVGGVVVHGVVVLLVLLHLLLIWALTCVALPELGHEVAVKHGLAHLLLLLRLGQLVGIEITDPRLVEHVLLLLYLVYVGQHFVNPRVVRRLKDYSRCVHLVDAQGAVATHGVAATLLSHAIGHEESLVGLLSSEHTVHTLRRRLALCPSVVLVVLVDESIGQGAVGHGMLVHSILLEVGHHVGQPRLRRGLGSLLLDLIHLL
mmetsp:Transcript_4103/g.6115  ORF Transcript_4103/g.6115 Transcript_4103/m.6115 type:complete len:223 (+) Transcript_4103:363-1031(+)